MSFEALTEFLDSLPAMGVPGMDCIIYREGQEIYRHLSGYMDIEEKIPINPEQVYHLYSTTKVVTCTAGLKLFEEGLYKLDDPLYEYIPEYKYMYIKDESGNIREAQNPILIRHLYTMCAGILNEIRCDAATKVRKETKGRCPTLSVVRELASEPLSFEPGRCWQYGLCHDVLGGLIEVLSGQTLGEYCKKHIFAPLGMDKTAFYNPEKKPEMLAPLYLYHPEEKRTERIVSHNVFALGPCYESGGASLNSTVSDYIRFADCLACGGQSKSGEKIIKRETIDLMRTNQLSQSQSETFTWPDLAGYGYGLGVRTMIDREKSGSKGSFGEFGWSGAAGAYVLIDPELKLSAYCGQHLLFSMSDWIHPRLRDLIYEGVKNERFFLH